MPNNARKTAEMAALEKICHDMLDVHHGRQTPIGVDAASFGMGARAGWDAACTEFYRRATLQASGTGPVVGEVEGEADDLDGRLKAQGMFTVAEMMGGTPLDRWIVHSGMTDLAAFEQWLDMKVREYLMMRLPYELGDKDQTDELYAWVLAHSAAFSTIRTNFKAAALATRPAADPDGQSEEVELDLGILPGDTVQVLAPWRVSSVHESRALVTLGHLEGWFDLTDLAPITKPARARGEA
jgi:hypothetical protein